MVNLEHQVEDYEVRATPLRVASVRFENTTRAHAGG